jgi:hypothetical protein
MSKFLINLPLQIYKALVYSKIKFLFRKEFFLHFRPNRPSGQPTHPAFQPSHDPLLFFQPAAPLLSTGPRPLGRPSPPSRLSRPSSSSSCTGAKRASLHRWPASRHPMVGPDDLHRRENNGRITPPSFSH